MNTKIERDWHISFRYISPWDHNTPLIHIPTEGTIVSAATADEAWEKFANSMEPEERRCLRRLQII